MRAGLLSISIAFILMGMLSGSLIALILFFIWLVLLLNPPSLKNLPDLDKE